MSDGLPDDRVVCPTCRHCDKESHRCRPLKVSVFMEVPLRCESYMPRLMEADQRNGRQRWPHLRQSIVEARALDLAHGR